MFKHDLIVIGGGILGLSHAYHALKKGLKVLMIEKNYQAMGASILNFGQVVPSGFGVVWQKYGIASFTFGSPLQNQRQQKSFAAQSLVDHCGFGTFGFGNTGILYRKSEWYALDDDYRCRFICALYLVQRYPF